MTSPLSRISTGSFFSGVIFEYSSFGWPGATAAGMNSILSIRPVSIAAMRTLRANGEAGEKVSFIFEIPWWVFSSVMPGQKCEARLRTGYPGIHVLALREKTWMAGSSPAMTS